MGNFRNQANLRTKASRFGGTTIMLSILLIGLFSTQKNKDFSTKTETLAPKEVQAASEVSTVNVNTPKTENKLESYSAQKSLASVAATAASTTSPKKVVSSLSTTSMVQYAGMEAMVDGNKGKVMWKTLAQRHIKSFEIERSIDDDTYVSIGSIEAEGSGEHMQELLYEFIDEKLGLVQMPRVYYRIKQIGFDGVEEYSEIIEHDFDLDLGLYARIEEKSSGKINILYAADKTGPITMKIFDVGGQILEKRDLQADFDPKLLAIDASNMKEGSYFLQLEDGATSVMEQFRYGK